MHVFFSSFFQIFAQYYGNISEGYDQENKKQHFEDIKLEGHKMK